MSCKHPVRKHDCLNKKLPCCNCLPCPCIDCPGVLEKLTTPISCELGIKASQCSAKKIPASCSKTCTLTIPQPEPCRKPSILNVLNDDRDCNCGLVARAVRADCFRFLGMRDIHEAKKNKKPLRD